VTLALMYVDTTRKLVMQWQAYSILACETRTSGWLLWTRRIKHRNWYLYGYSCGEA